MLESSVLVLNRSYIPIHITSVRRAFVMIFQGLARAVHADYQTFDFDSWRRLPVAEGEAGIGTPNGAIRVPRVVVLSHFDRIPLRHVRYSRVNVFARDKFTCQYCGRRPQRSELNIDHVVPRAHGGATTWENVVCSCIDCNRRKGGRTPQQARFVLKRSPTRPRWTPLVNLAHTPVRHDEWKPFLGLVDGPAGGRAAAG